MEEKIEMQNKPLKMSVAIIAKKAEETITYTLDSLQQQSRKPDELLVIVPSLEDTTLSVVNKYPNVRIAVDNKATRGSARQIAVNTATGDIVAFIDAECIAHQDWLNSLEKVYNQHPEVKAQGGPIIGFRYFGQPITDPIPSDNPLRYIKFIPTANLSFRRKDAIEAGNFSQILHEGEDLDFCAKLSEHNISIVLNQNAIVRHLDRSNMSLLKRYLNYGKSRAKVLFLHPKFVFSSAVVAAAHFLLVPLSIIALVFQRYDLAIISILLPFAHELYKFMKSSDWHVHAFTFKEFSREVLLSYSLYTGFALYFFPSLANRNKVK